MVAICIFETVNASKKRHKVKKKQRKVGKPKLTPKQARFVGEYLVDLNATKAAKRAGYGLKNAKQQGTENLAKPSICAAIAVGKQKQIDESGLTAVEILKQLKYMASVDVRSFFDENNNLKPVSELTEAQGAQLASMEVIVKNAAAGDGHTDTVHKFKVWDKTKAVDLAMKHFGLLVDRIEHQGEVSYRWLTHEAEAVRPEDEEADQEHVN